MYGRTTRVTDELGGSVAIQGRRERNNPDKLFFGFTQLIIQKLSIKSGWIKEEAVLAYSMADISIGGKDG